MFYFVNYIFYTYILFFIFNTLERVFIKRHSNKTTTRLLFLYLYFYTLKLNSSNNNKIVRTNRRVAVYDFHINICTYKRFITKINNSYTNVYLRNSFIRWSQFQ